MKVIAIEEAVGKKIGHELTGIIPGKKENITYLKGYVIKEDDIEILKNMGKYHINILEDQAGMLHENDGARILGAKLCGQGIKITEPKEGKVQGLAEYQGVVISDVESIMKINLTDGLKFATKKSYSIVAPGDRVAVASITPLEIEEQVLTGAIAGITEPIIKVLPVIKQKIALITTGTEVYEGRIKDAFLPFLQSKLEPYGYEDLKQIIVPDDLDKITVAIDDSLAQGYEMIFLTGGMSVDADDFTLRAVKEYEGMEVVIYGSPVLPGAMFLAAYHDKQIPFIGLPAGLLRGGRSILDLILPLLLVRQRLTKEFIAGLGDGGIA